MDNLDSRIRELIVGYFLEELNAEERDELLAWVRENREHEYLFKKHIRELYAVKAAGAWDSVHMGEAKEQVYRKLYRFRNAWRVGVAAAVAMLLTSSAFLYLHKERSDAFVEKRLFSELMQYQDRNQAILSIGEDKKMVLNALRQQTIHADSHSRVFVDDSCVIRYEEIAHGVSKEVALHTLEVPIGSEFSAVLSDGTRVWMNAQTKLSYPESFTGETREVFLSGEAYFEVAHDAEKPFIVETADMGITVLGTSFNVKAYPDDESVITTLATGKIKQKYVASGEEIVLRPSEQAVYVKSRGSLRVERVNAGEAIGWKNGRVILKNKPLKEIFRELARWYDFEVEYKSKRLENTRFYLNMDRYDDVKMVLEKLQKTNGIKFIFYGRKIIVYDDTIIK